MQRQPMLKCGLLTLMLVAAALQPARADFELSDSNGRRILLKDNGTWKFADAEDGKDKDPGATPAAPEAQADLQLMRRVDAAGGCQFNIMVTNHLSYEIESLVPAFAAQRNSGVIYATKSIGFAAVKPGDSRVRQLLFEGISCQDITKLHVVGGDRCEMGELNRFTDGKGKCLALVRVVPSDLLKFEK
jgi:hypothetical protein